jgi:hypothetical protein
MTSRGVLTYCYGKSYEKFAYVLADTCRQQDIQLTIVSNNKDLLKHPDINLVYKEPKTLNIFEIEKYSYVLSPYDLTLKLDVDTLILGSVDNYFETAEHLNIVYGTPNNYCTTPSLENSSPYRIKEKEQGLPEVYSAALCFNKSPVSRDFFYKVKFLFENWFSLDVSKHLSPTTDTVMSLAWRLQDLPSVASLKFTHFKEGLAYSSSSKKMIWYADGIILNGHKLDGIFHYYEKDFLEKHRETIRCLLS